MMEQTRIDTTLPPSSFKAIADLTYAISGLILVAEKTSMIQSRLRHRLRALNMPDFDSYSRYVCSDQGLDERRQMISALTTNVSHFFRERHHFDILADTILPMHLPRLRAGGRLRIWSAGCSNGQEACSIAITLLDRAPELGELDLRILATDIDPQVVRYATHGRYRPQQMGGVDDALLSRYFHSNGSGAEQCYVAGPALRRVIRYRELNLLSPWPMQQPIDVIFCRNVVIYFDQTTQSTLWPRFRDALSPNGWLFLGHSERIADSDAAGFRSDGPTAYRPVTACSASSPCYKGPL